MEAFSEITDQALSNLHSDVTNSNSHNKKIMKFSQNWLLL